MTPNKLHHIRYFQLLKSLGQPCGVWLSTNCLLIIACVMIIAIWVIESFGITPALNKLHDGFNLTQSLLLNNSLHYIPTPFAVKKQTVIFHFCMFI